MLATIRTIRALSGSADVVYLNGLVLEGVLATKVLRRRPVVVKVVGDLIWEKLHATGRADIGIQAFQMRHLGLRFSVLRKLQAWYTRRADFIITPSHFLKEIVAGWGVDRSRIVVVHNAVAGCPAPMAADVSFDVVCVGRLIGIKCMDAVIRVCASRQWRLLIVGDGPLRQELSRLAEDLEAGGLVTFAGHVPKHEVAHAIRRARVFVLNSSHEGFPHVILEAKQAGVPVVATRVGGVPELVTSGVDGILVPPGDDSVLANAIEQVLTDAEKRRALVAAGEAQVRELFSWPALVTRTQAVLRDAGSAMAGRHQGALR